MRNLTPKEIVSELDRFIVGQRDAKRAVAVALRNRWRRMQLDPTLMEEVLPKNILMIGPTGVGKTEIARRLAKLADAPFIKVEATKFTEIGYVGRDVEQIIRDLMEMSIHMTRDRLREEVKGKAHIYAIEKVLDVLVGETASSETREKFRQKLADGDLMDKDVEIFVTESSSSLSMPTVDIPGMPGAQMGMMNLGDMLGKSLGEKKKKIKTTVKEAIEIFTKEECDNLIDDEAILSEAKKSVEQKGIVFIDEIDKICARRDNRGGEVSREGVQRDLLPLIEGTTVNTKHGAIKTDHILFVTSGAFHLSSPSDLLPELQGRLPIRVELRALSQNDFVRILTEPEANLIKQATALLGTENFTLTFEDDAINEIASLAARTNHEVENIGARRLYTILEKLLEEVSFDAPDTKRKKLVVTKDLVTEKVGDIVQNQDLSKFVL